MSWLQNQQLTTLCVGFILRARTEWSRWGHRHLCSKQDAGPELEVQAGGGGRTRQNGDLNGICPR